MVYNTITGNARANNTTLPIRMRLVGTTSWANGVFDSVTGYYVCTLGNVPAGSYGPGTIQFQLLGSNPDVSAYNTTTVSVSNAPSGSTTPPPNQKPSVSFAPVTSSVPTVGVAKDYLALATDSDGSITLTELVRVTSPSDLTVLAVLASDTTSPYSLSWTPAAAGTVYLAARTTDNSGESTLSSVLTVPVQAAASTSWNGLPALIVDDGDSIVAGLDTSPGARATDLYQAAYGGNFVVKNVGVSGIETTGSIAKAPNTVYALRDTTKYSSHTYIIRVGVNDVLHDAEGRTNITPAGSKANIEKLCRDAIAAGYKVLVCTILPTGSAADYMPRINDYNQYIRDNWQAWGCSGLIDLANEPALKNNYDRTFYNQGGLHPNDYGNQFIAPPIKAKLDALLAPTGIPIPAYTWATYTAFYNTVYAPQAGEDVVWIDLANATARGNTLNLSGGGTGHSTKAIGVSSANVRGYVEVQMLDFAGEYLVALTDTDHVKDSPGYGDMSLAMQIRYDQVRLFGSTAPYSPYFQLTIGDKVRIQLEINGVSLYINSKRIITYVQQLAAVNYQLDTAVLGAGSISNVKLYAANLVVVGAVAPPPTSPDTYSSAVGQNVVWSSNGGVTINANTLIYERDTTAQSTQALGESAAAVRGYVEFSVADLTSEGILSFNTNPYGSPYSADHRHGIYLVGDQVQAYGSLVPTSGVLSLTIAVGDKIRMQIEKNRFAYFKNGVLWAAYAATFETEKMCLDTQGFQHGVFADAKIYGANLVDFATAQDSSYWDVQGEPVEWVNLVNATANGNTLNMGGNVSGANSSKAIGAAATAAGVRGFFEYTVTTLTGEIFFGLSNHAGDGPGLNDIPYLLQFREGVLNTFRSFAQGYGYPFYPSIKDVFRLQVETTRFTLHRNKARLLTITIAPTTDPLAIDGGGYGATQLGDVKIGAVQLI